MKIGSRNGERPIWKPKLSWMQMSCVSGAQLSNYAIYLVHPEHAPLSIVLTALSTLCGAILTPALIRFHLGNGAPPPPLLTPALILFLLGKCTPPLPPHARPRYVYPGKCTFILFRGFFRIEQWCLNLNTSSLAHCEPARLFVHFLDTWANTLSVSVQRLQ